MEDLIPLFIVILLGIVGALGRKKRKRIAEEEIAEPRQQSTDDDMFSWLNKFQVEDEPVQEKTDRQFLFDEPETQQAVEVEEKPVEKAAPEPARFLGFSGFITEEEKARLMAKEGISALHNEKVQADEKKGDTEKEEITHQPKKKWAVSDFDLKKAVIYSEILNRKYID